MAGFPKIPLVLGDTDDDASIHLNSKIGPSKPLPPMKKSDREILKILNGTTDTHENHNEYDEFNRNFEIFKKTGKLPEIEDPVNGGVENTDPEKEEEDEEEDDDYTESDVEEDANDSDSDSDFDEDATEVESIQSDFDINLEPKGGFSPTQEKSKFDNSTPEDTEGNFFQQYRNLIISAVVILLLEVILITSYKLTSRFGLSAAPDNKIIDNYYEVNSKFNKLDDEILKISQINSNLISNQELLVQNYQDLNENINATIQGKFNELAAQFSLLEAKIPTKHEQLFKDFDSLKSDFQNFKSVTNFTEFNNKLSVLGDRLSHLTALNEDFESLKAEFLQSFIDNLPNHLPIYIKNNKIHYIPEFNKFLYNFIDSYTKEKAPQGDWNQFLQNNKESLNKHISQIMEESGIAGMNKQSFQKILNEKLSKNNQVIFDKFNNLVDQLSVSGNGTDSQTKLSHLTLDNSDDLFLNNLLDLFAKGSINTNYADYKLGSRILGFLTSTGFSGKSEGDNGKSLNRKLFLGWYDYLANSSPNPSQLKYNANNVLIDGGESWQCNSQTCSLGIRLSNSIVLTDLVLKSLDINTKPNAVSIYIRPNSKSQYHNLLQYLQEFKIPTKFKYGINSSINHKYLSKFIKIKEMMLSEDKLDHIKLPVSLINMKVPIRDIYFEFHNLNGANKEMQIFNLKAFGISEYNYYKFNKEFDLLISNLQRSVVNEHNTDMYTSDNDGVVTVSDEFDISILGEELL